MDFALTPKGQEFLARLKAFMATKVIPHEQDYLAEIRRLCPGSDWTKWQLSQLMEDWKAKAKAEGLWNLFLPDPDHGAGLSLQDYAHLAEEMGRIPFASEIFNCNAPDTGNMEVLHYFGNDAQKEQWLTPLLAGEIRSAFCMTEPEVASSDATTMEAKIVEDGGDLILNGRKWWSTGIGHPNAAITIFMGLSNPEADKHAQHSMVLVPLDTPGVKIERMLPTFGEYDPPLGHGEVTFTDVRVPKDNLILGMGRGFEIAQGRLGPGRIHHCMRAIGAAERALELMIRRGNARVAFGRKLTDLGANRDHIGRARIAIDQARLLTLYAAWKIDTLGVRAAMAEISAIKVVAPSVLQEVVDRAMQIHGGMGLTHDVPLTDLYILARALRYADGPDEVHLAQVARSELKKYAEKRR